MEFDKILYLSRKEVEEVNLQMSEIIEVLEQMFKEKGAGRVEMPPKNGIYMRSNSFILAMPAYIPSLESAGMKWVSVFPENQKKGLPFVSGLLVLNDPETGAPIAIMDCTWITAKRTGAATAIAAKYLARKDSSTVGIVACGVQGRSNLEALSSVFKIRKVKAFDIYPEITNRYTREMEEKLKIEIEPVKELSEAVKNLDIVVTSGPILKNPEPSIRAGWLARGSFASPLDYDSYWTGEALREVDKLATDDIAQMSYYRKEGWFQETPEPYADLGEIVARKQSGRESDDERIIAMNLGLALEDVVTASLIYKKAIDRGIGIELTL